MSKPLSALDVLHEFVSDCELASRGMGLLGTAQLDADEFEKLDWPDLYETYKLAKTVLGSFKPYPFDQRRYEDPQGVIDDLIAQTIRQGVDIHHLAQALRSAEGEPEPADKVEPKLIAGWFM